MQFNFSVFNNRKKQIWLLAYGLMIVNGLIFLLFALKSNIYKLAFIYSALLITTTLVSIFIKKYKSIFYNVSYLLIAFSWIQLNYPWIGVLLIILLSVTKKFTADIAVTINEKEVEIKNVFSNNYQWSSFQNVILKDKLLTLDFKNNKILQVEILNKTTLEQEKEFNEFCQSCLKT
ncbi:MAG TPA: hypothetical protein PKG56_06910 [Chitinophagaceae bacterium]|nr:hypothetical protein [Chitinophagaceae bacterium]MCC6635900.1 hypothetical protein [Chitinophagaceae bacterium]HMZ45407.1 hypothetical protein [Chitinophagaceae bacterium]HNE94064.1 hypothetical protein [Chitinophagaceae bacterium]HNF29186.1 hypothetical protein [Chitinophagaceae bacterium]